jgi:ABC-type uncharacterized transport system involved in gliding motility auxiliary subunit
MRSLQSYRKYLRFLAWPGLALITAGVVAGFVGAWTVLPIVLLLVGLLLLLVSFVLGGYSFSTFWQSRSTQAGTNAVVATLSVLAILGVLNFLGARYDQRFDLTEAQLFTLAPESQTVVKNLEQPVEVLLFQGAPNPTDKQLLESYRRFNPDLSYEYIDPYGQPQLAQQYGVQTVGEVYLKAGDKQVFVQRVNQQETLSEKQLTNKLDQLGVGESPVVYFLQGHGEYPIDGTETGYFQAANTLQEDNFTVATLNLADTKSIPEDADTVVVAGPQQAFFEAERKALETYLDQGGSALIMIDPQVESGLEPLLEQWGIGLNERLIVDTSGGGQLVGLGPAAPLVTDYGSHPITDDFKNGRSFYPLARPLTVTEVPGVEVTPLLRSNAQSYAEPISEGGQLEVDTQKSPEGPFEIGVALSRPVTTQQAAAQEDSNTTEDEAALESGSQIAEGASAPGSAEVEIEVTDPTSSDGPGEEATETELTEAESPEPEPSEPDAESAEPGEAPAAEESEVETETTETETTTEPSVEEARLVVIGNSTFATDGLFGQQLNGDVFLNSVTWLSQVDSPTLSIRPKEITNRRIVMTVTQQIVVIVLALLVLPAIALVGGGVMWFRRR